MILPRHQSRLQPQCSSVPYHIAWLSETNVRQVHCTQEWLCAKQSQARQDQYGAQAHLCCSRCASGPLMLGVVLVWMLVRPAEVCFQDTLVLELIDKPHRQRELRLCAAETVLYAFRLHGKARPQSTGCHCAEQCSTHLTGEAGAL